MYKRRKVVIGVGMIMGRTYSPALCTALELLEYMVLRKEEGPFTLYHLMNYAVRSHQRRDRMRRMLELMVRAGWVEVLHPRRYRVTAKGEEIYRKSEELREFFRVLRLGKEDDPFCPGNSFPPSLNTPDGLPPTKREVRRMKVVIRRLGASGDTCFTCVEQELGSLLADVRGEYQVAIRTEEGTRLLGEDPETVLEAVEERRRSGASEVELLLLPRVRGG